LPGPLTAFAISPKRPRESPLPDFGNKLPPMPPPRPPPCPASGPSAPSCRRFGVVFLFFLSPPFFLFFQFVLFFPPVLFLLSRSVRFPPSKSKNLNFLFFSSRFCSSLLFFQPHFTALFFLGPPCSLPPAPLLPNFSCFPVSSTPFLFFSFCLPPLFFSQPFFPFVVFSFPPFFPRHAHLFFSPPVFLYFSSPQCVKKKRGGTYPLLSPTAAPVNFLPYFTRFFFLPLFCGVTNGRYHGGATTKKQNRQNRRFLFFRFNSRSGQRPYPGQPKTLFEPLFGIFFCFFFFCPRG